MPTVNDIPQQKPWYKKPIAWAWIVIGALFLALIIIMSVQDAQEKKAKAGKGPLRPWSEVLTPEERHQ